MTDEHRFILPKVRLEALVDGVFAIAMTILVLEVRIPELQDPRSRTELADALRHAWPTVAAYLFSFLMLGLFWVWHHRLAAKLRQLDSLLITVSLLFLATVSFFPFAAGLLGRYMGNRVSLMVYLPVVAMILVLQVLFYGLAMRRGLLHEDLSPAEVLAPHRRNLRGCFIFFVANLPNCLRFGWTALAICGVLATFFGILLRRARLPRPA
ncbi:MAG TPA: TMEM175 family protein [Holophagaceae bacterium]|nr:TMEM175 family protein [Holophagaceae bacterium]